MERQTYLKIIKLLNAGRFINSRHYPSATNKSQVIKSQNNETLPASASRSIFTIQIRRHFWAQCYTLDQPSKRWISRIQFSFYFRTIYEVYCENVSVRRQFWRILLDIRKEGGIAGRFYCGIITLSLLSPRFVFTFDFSSACAKEGDWVQRTLHHLSKLIYQRSKKQIKTNEFNA